MNKKLVSYSFVLLVSLSVINLSVIGTKYEDNFGLYNSSIFEPLLVVTLFIFLSSFSLLFFSDQIFHRWLKNIISWYAPLAFLLILSGTTGGSYVWLPRVDVAVLVGWVLVVITVLFSLIQRFYYHR